MAIVQTSEPATTRPDAAGHPPPLENGDRLAREEFERRYAAMPDVKKAELIQGVVYMGSAARFRAHGRPRVLLLTWLGMYRALTLAVFGTDNPTVRPGPGTEHAAFVARLG